MFCCVGEVLGVSCWADEVLGVSRWVARWKEEALGVSGCVKAVWLTPFWAERWREGAWWVALRGPLCGVAEEAWLSADRCGSKEKYPLSPRSFAQCCPVFRLPLSVSGERRSQFKVRGEARQLSHVTFLCPLGQMVREDPTLSSWKTHSPDQVAPPSDQSRGGGL